jgi:GDPmannose 4,6-dehydratase
MRINPNFYRPLEVDVLYGDSTETKKLLNWEPKTSFKQLVEKMIENDLQLVS